MSLRDRIEALAASSRSAYGDAERATFAEFRSALSRGAIRAAERGADGAWRANAWVKQGILLGFRIGALTDLSVDGTFRFFDKDTYPVRGTTLADRVRIVPGGSTIRDGAYVAPGVVCMPPMFVNVGAYVDEGTLIDSHVLVGSCAQIRRQMHPPARWWPPEPARRKERWRSPRVCRCTRRSSSSTATSVPTPRRCSRRRYGDQYVSAGEISR